MVLWVLRATSCAAFDVRSEAFGALRVPGAGDELCGLRDGTPGAGDARRTLLRQLMSRWLPQHVQRRAAGSCGGERSAAELYHCSLS